MFDLNETEYVVLIADRIYRTKEEKVRFLNMKLGLVDEDGKQINPKKWPISNATFYRILKRAKEKTSEKLSQIVLHSTEDLMIDFEMLEQMHARQYRAAEIAFDKGDWSLFNRLVRSWLEYLPYLTAMRETCEMVHKKSKWEGLDDIDPPRPPPKYHAFSE